MEPVKTPLDLTSPLRQCLASDSYAEGLNLLALSLHQVAEAARILKEGARGIEAARVRNMLSVAAKQAQSLLSEEPIETPLDLSSVVKQFWEAPDEALFSQKDLVAVTGLSPAYFERGRWAGYGPPFIKIGRLVRYQKGHTVSWLNKRPAVSSTTEAAEKYGPQFGSPRGPRKKREQARAKRRTGSGRKPTPEPPLLDQLSAARRRS